MRPVLLVCLLATVLVAPRLAGEAVSGLWGRDGEAWTPRSRLPDFSFAGYGRGEREIPSPRLTRDIRDFGAVGDGVADDTAAFKRAIEETAFGVIFIPNGRYRITDIIEIRKSNVVLRGENRGDTVLFFPRPLNDVRPDWGETTSDRPTSNYSWSGGFIWVRGSFRSEKLADITAPAARGDRLLSAAPLDRLRVGQEIEIRQRDTAHNTLAQHVYSDDPGDISNLRGSTSTELTARITALSEDGVEIDRPLRTDVRLEWTPEIRRFDPTVTNVGVENLTIEFPVTDYQGHFTESGFNPVAFSNVAHCWIRDLRVLHADNGPMISGRFCTIDGLLLETGRRPERDRETTGHHGIYLYGDDNLFTRFDFRVRFIHDITVSTCAGNVISAGRGLDLCLDHHKRAPHENLFTDLDLGAGARMWRCGGGAALGKNCAARGTFRNIRAAAPQAYPPDNFGPDSINLVGVFARQPGATDPAGRWFETMPPAGLTPQNLHLAQRARRLAATNE